ncbi:MAG: 4-alpha-glucanotransferase [Leptospira sp.]|nr:4-alpha-glucanotransferase [Leptospira sp.]
MVRHHPILKRRAGVLVPLSSILTKNSFECGDIASLVPLAHFAKEAGFSLLQLLPLNDTGIDTSPYSAISAFAIDPIYISLHALGVQITSRREKIASQRINHFRIRELKLIEIRKIFESDKTKNTNTALQFLSNFPWAYGYSAFRVLYDDYKGAEWSTWNKNHKEASKAKEEIFNTRKDEALFYAFVQSIAFEQLKKAKEELELIGVYLKGDMPILTSRNSADVWEYPEYFQLDLQAGAPPDAFSDDGQNWGFPILNWPNLRQTDFRWWRERLEYLENFFHLFRIDHVIGMYRIWAIPVAEKTARKGWFSPQIGTSKEQFDEVNLNPEDFVKLDLIHEFRKDHYIFYWDFWKNESYQNLPEEIKRVFFPLSEHNLKLDEITWNEAGEEILDAMDRFSRMIPCAEDLGAVPSFIRDSLKRRDMLGIDVVRWTRSLENGEYIPSKGYRETAISVLSTHDTSLVFEWWNSLQGQEKEYAENFFFANTDEESFPKTNEEIALGLLEFAFSTNSLFSIQILQDLLYKDEYGITKDPSAHRVNIPGTEAETNWSYRFSMTIEDLISDKELIHNLRKLITQADRI